MLQLFKYPSIMHRYALARRIQNFYKTSFERPQSDKIRSASMLSKDDIMTYLWDIHEEIDMLDVIQEPTDDLRSLYNDLQTLLDYAL